MYETFINWPHFTFLLIDAKKDISAIQVMYIKKKFF